MIEWLKLNDEQRKAVIDETEIESGIGAKVIEKDWWVTLTLKALFQSAYAQYMAFKGGTSLSKGWNLIQRFSEDIDIALDPQAFNMQYAAQATSGFINRLKRAGCAFTTNELKTELENQFRQLQIPEGILRVEAEAVPEGMPDKDPQVLYVHYPSLYEPDPYIADSVKIEVSVRSLQIPFREIPMQSILYAINPKPAYAEVPFNVKTVEPRKTMLEKLFLLHEEFSRPERGRIRTERMSRHLYDLHQLMQTDTLLQALADQNLYEQLIQHRQQYNRLPWVDYTTHTPALISFIPPSEVIEAYQSDYQTMQAEMIYGEAADFEQLISNLKMLQGMLRLKHTNRKLEHVLATAISQIQKSDQFTGEDNTVYSTQIVYTKDPYEGDNMNNEKLSCTVTMLYKNKEFRLETIKIEG